MKALQLSHASLLSVRYVVAQPVYWRPPVCRFCTKPPPLTVEEVDKASVPINHQEIEQEITAGEFATRLKERSYIECVNAGVIDPQQKYNLVRSASWVVDGTAALLSQNSNMNYRLTFEAVDKKTNEVIQTRLKYASHIQSEARSPIIEYALRWGFVTTFGSCANQIQIPKVIHIESGFTVSFLANITYFRMKEFPGITVVICTSYAGIGFGFAKLTGGQLVLQHMPELPAEILRRKLGINWYYGTLFGWILSLLGSVYYLSGSVPGNIRYGRAIVITLLENDETETQKQ